MRTPRDVVREQVREIRKRRGMTQQGLADRLNQLGAQTDRTAVAKIEAGTREIALGEAFQLALALDVAPVHLLVPTDSTEPIDLAPNLQASPFETRAWIRGQMPLFQDARIYYSLVPETEFRHAQDTLDAWRESSPIGVTTTGQEGDR